MERESLVESYHNALLDLQIKYRYEQDKYLTYIILYLFFLEYLTNPTPTIAVQRCPLLKEIDIKDFKTNIKDIESGVNHEGKLSNAIKNVVYINGNEIDYLNSIIPNKRPNIKEKSKSKQEQYYEKLVEEQDIVEQNHKTVEFMNNVILGKRFKVWNTQRDDRVRKTTFHNGIDRQRVEIGETFNVNDIIARYPQDRILPLYESFNCRCYLTYE
jgi:hypothetical protein